MTLIVGQAAAIGSLDDPASTAIRGWLWLGTVAFAAPWLVGAVLLLVRVQLGAIVVAAAATLAVPGLLLGWVLAVGAQLVGMCRRSSPRRRTSGRR
jgi:hypothetical protein